MSMKSAAIAAICLSQAVAFNSDFSRPGAITSLKSNCGRQRVRILNQMMSDLKEMPITLSPTSDSSDNSVVKHLFDWETQWYPLAVATYTDRNITHKLQFLGEDVVLWHDGSNWRVFEDSCPHRNVPLSEGRIEKNGELLCAYHAWTFNGKGECTKIPQAKSEKKEKILLSNPLSCVRSYPTQEAQGLVWVCRQLTLSLYIVNFNGLIRNYDILSTNTNSFNYWLMYNKL